MQLPLRFDAAALQAEVRAIPESAWRPHPQGYPGNDALTLIATGGDPASDAASGAMRSTEHLERSPYLMRVLDSIGATWGRTRLMRLSGHAEVMPHVDVNYYWRERVRVHVPIVTQPTVRFVCGGEQINMREGECWIFDTWRSHHVVNDHALPRIHLVADTVGGAAFWEHMRNARPGGRELPGWTPRLIEPGTAAPRLDFESQNLPAVMTPLGNSRAHRVHAVGGNASPEDRTGVRCARHVRPRVARAVVLLRGRSRRLDALSRVAGRDPAGLGGARRRRGRVAQRRGSDGRARRVGLRTGVGRSTQLRGSGGTAESRRTITRRHQRSSAKSAIRCSTVRCSSSHRREPGRRSCSKRWRSRHRCSRSATRATS